MEQIPIKYSKKNVSDIINLISEYSKTYQKFEDFQDILLASGDQKTGVIGEYYAALYIQKEFGVSTVYSKSNSEHDIEYIHKNKTYKIQVKTVSAHSDTRTISPIKNGDWSELYLISLDKNFEPNGFWINTKQDLQFDDDGKISYVRMPKITSKLKKGRIDFTNNQINKL